MSMVTKSRFTAIKRVYQLLIELDEVEVDDDVDDDDVDDEDDD